jgi:hypothetical protein
MASTFSISTVLPTDPSATAAGHGTGTAMYFSPELARVSTAVLKGNIGRPMTRAMMAERQAARPPKNESSGMRK